MSRRFANEIEDQEEHSRLIMESSANLESKENKLIVICRAQPEDALAIQHLYEQLVNGPGVNVTSGAIQRLADDPYNFLIVGKVEGNVSATALLTICRDVMYDDQPFAVAENIVIDSRLRGLGYGFALMNHLKQIGKDNRCTKIMLLSSAQRADAHSFFETCGYRGDLKRGFVNYINR